jgi:hypothetical protein
MSDAIQVAIVSAVAAAALATLVRSYLRRPQPKKSGPPCATCAASAAPSTPAGRPTHS